MTDPKKKYFVVDSGGYAYVISRKYLKVADSAAVQVGDMVTFQDGKKLADGEVRHFSADEDQAYQAASKLSRRPDKRETVVKESSGQRKSKLVQREKMSDWFPKVKTSTKVTKKPKQPKENAKALKRKATLIMQQSGGPNEATQKLAAEKLSSESESESSQTSSIEEDTVKEKAFAMKADVRKLLELNDAESPEGASDDKINEIPEEQAVATIKAGASFHAEGADLKAPPLPESSSSNGCDSNKKNMKRSHPEDVKDSGEVKKNEEKVGKDSEGILSESDDGLRKAPKKLLKKTSEADTESEDALKIAADKAKKKKKSRKFKKLSSKKSSMSKKSKKSKKSKRSKAKKPKKERRPICNPEVYEGQNYLYSAESSNVMKLHENYDVFVRKADYDRCSKAKTASVFLRQMVDKIYTIDALKNATPGGFPKRGKGTKYYKTHVVLPKLHPDGLDALRDATTSLETEKMKDRNTRNGWNPPLKLVEMNRILSNKISGFKEPSSDEETSSDSSESSSSDEEETSKAKQASSDDSD